uniref:(northern house mosquito) hypothetical protein n=1 Tax=Culex pipiens TaxID=7175 RepID=A0A8D8CCC9_CULPI
MVLPQLVQLQWLSSLSLPSIHHLVAVSFNSAADDSFLAATVLLSLILLVTGVLTGGTSGHRDIGSNLQTRERTCSDLCCKRRLLTARMSWSCSSFSWIYRR